ncbi:ribosomal RNA small subunit methyltransferase A [[Mycoplasma] falconis]|uniref:Ribosomal RNA small subunit methyltransferase A n=1 Tax=[Mycoplasma] falconis TaxID=92403 RepID=A0A501XA44_9BACT|nr:16S rRNA (adenine(1518)-N(6)/adenine(1519)-N(6))-dimethyltransferase RsmA [[Mycoplasma] falconis]TPE57371.1 ribosomal RNA small subunit methyltransferase A [[Mycoplasma] falconis]
MEIKAKKSFGQNFLINKNIQQKIVEAAEVNNEDVIEIGPGLGALTNHLIDKVKTLNCYELDLEIYNLWLNKALPSNIHFKHQDFLEANLDLENKLVVIGNIPYNITSDIIFKLIRSFKTLKRATLMVQKEVADRLVASPNSKAYSKLTLSVNLVASVKKIINVKANEFNPVPKVDSAVVRLDFVDNIDFNLEKMLHFIKIIFQFKRKTLINNLQTSYPKELIVKSLEKLNLSLNVRAEQLDLNQIKSLYVLLENL